MGGPPAPIHPPEPTDAVRYVEGNSFRCSGSHTRCCITAALVVCARRQYERYDLTAERLPSRLLFSDVCWTVDSSGLW